MRASRRLLVEPLETRQLLAGNVQLVRDLNVDGDASPRWLAGVGNTLFFDATNGPSNGQLWKSNGTAGGTTQVGLTSPILPTNVNGTLFFNGNNGLGERELWRSDGTEVGTFMVKDIFLGNGNYGPNASNPSQLTNLNGKLMFAAQTAAGLELWRSDGTAAGTVLVKDIYPGVDEETGRPNSSEPYNLVNVSGTLFFHARTSTGGIELWKSDGTTAGTKSVHVFYLHGDGAGVRELTNVNGTLFFFAYDPTHSFKLWKSNGTDATTVPVGEFATPSNFIIDHLTNVAGTLYFQAADNFGDTELWRSDGTNTGTLRVKDILPGPESSDPDNLINVGGVLMFSAKNGAGERQLWKSDGTAAGTARVKGVVVAPRFAAPKGFANVEGTLYFSADDGHTGYELWKSDGTTAGTVQVANLAGGAASSRPHDLTVVNGSLYFGAQGFYGDELYVLPRVANHAPVLDTSATATLGTIAEDTASPFGKRVADLLGSAPSDVDPAALEGIAVVAATGATNGRWQYTLNDGVSWQALGAVSANEARLLPATSATRLRFLPNEDFNGQTTLAYRAWDRTQGLPGRLYDTTGQLGGRNAFSLARESALLTIAPVNDAPVLAGIGGSQNYVRGAAAVVLAAAATVRDVDSANLAGGRLRVRFAFGAATTNILAIGGNFTLDANNNVRFGDKVIGKRTGSGFGTTDLIVTFNFNATPFVTQQLIRSITFRTTGGPAGQRRITFSLTDGDGGPSNELTKTVNVT